MRLIDSDALANDLLYDIEMDANALDNADLVGIERERIQFDKDCKQNCVYYLTETEPIDAMKVIRCKDCKCKDKYENFCWMLLREIDPSDYCSDAEWREE